MSKTIFAVSGTAQKGKTSALRALAKHLLSNYAHDVIDGAVSETKDFRLVVKINEKTIAIESKGDPNTGLQKRLLDLSDNFHADIIFCATRTKGDTVNAVYNLKQTREFEVVWTSTYEMTKNHDVASDLKGRHLIALMQGLKEI